MHPLTRGGWAFHLHSDGPPRPARSLPWTRSRPLVVDEPVSEDVPSFVRSPTQRSGARSAGNYDFKGVPLRPLSKDDAVTLHRTLYNDAFRRADPLGPIVSNAFSNDGDGPVRWLGWAYGALLVIAVIALAWYASRS